MSYTPGPWSTFTASMRRRGVVRHTVGTADVRICDMWGKDPAFYTAEDAANARLIAAAPDLLVAAVHALEVLRDREWSGIGHLRSQLEEAIAKAEEVTA